MTEKQTYLDLIREAFTSSNNLSRKNAEQTLLDKCNNEMSCINCILDILSDDTQNATIQESAAILMTIVVGKFEKKKDYLNSDQMYKHVSALSLMLNSSNTRFRSHIELALLKLKSLRGAQIQQTQTINLQGNCYRMLMNENLDDLQGGLQLLKFITEQLEKETSFYYIWEYVKIGSQLVKKMQLRDKLIIKQTQTMCKLWALISELICNKAFERKNIHMQQLSADLISNHDFIASLCDILFYQRIQSENPLISSGSRQRFKDSQINDAKGSAFTTLNRLCLEQKYGVLDLSQKANLLRLSLQTMRNFTTSNSFDINRSVDAVHLKKLVTQIIHFIAKQVTDNEFYNDFCNQDIVLSIVFPLLMSSQQDIKMMEDNPQEFILSSLDLIYQQEFMTPKVKAGNLLRNLTIYIDGCYTQTLNLCQQLLQQSLQNDPSTQLNENQIYTKFSPLQRQEASILVLCLITVNLKHRPDLIGFVVQICKDLQTLPQLSQLISSRIILLQGVLCKSIIHYDRKQLTSLLEVITQSFHGVVNLELSLNMLYLVIKDSQNVKYLENNLFQIISVLYQSFKIQKYQVQFDILGKIIKLYHHKLADTAFLLDPIITLLNDNLNGIQKSKDDQFWIIKTLHIIRSLVEHDQHLVDNINKIQNMLDFLYQMLKNPLNAIFYEDILTIMSTNIIKIRSTSQNQRQLFELFPCIQIYQENKLLVLFEVLNNMILYCTDIFQDNNLQRILLGLLQRSLYCGSEVDEGETLLLIQLIIMQKVLLPEHLEQIYSIIFQKANQTIKFRFLKSRLLGVFLCGFLYDYERTRAILIRHNIYDNILISISQYTEICEPGYDTKLYVLALCQFIKSDPNLIQELVTKILVALQTQINHESQKLQTIRQTESDTDEEIELVKGFNLSYTRGQNQSCLLELEEIKFDEALYRAQKSMDLFKSKIDDVDEFEVFYQTIQLAQTQNMNDHQFLQNPQLSQILSFRRIKDEYGNQIVRSIIKSKRRKQYK